jgi:hypothetical protein
MGRPIYESIVAACKVGCFCCGAVLDPERAREVANKAGHYRITCEACDEPKTFEVSAPKKAEKPTRQTKNDKR